MIVYLAVVVLLTLLSAWWLRRCLRADKRRQRGGLVILGELGIEVVYSKHVPPGTFYFGMDPALALRASVEEGPLLTHVVETSHDRWRFQTQQEYRIAMDPSGIVKITGI